MADMSLQAAKVARDVARNMALYGPRNTCHPWGDHYARWLHAHPDDRRAYEAAVENVRRALQGTRYANANPEHV